MPARRKPSHDALPAVKKTAIGKSDESTVSEQAAFEEIVGLIERSRLQAVRAVNTSLIDLYWNVGEYISRKIQGAGWGKGTVQALSAFVQKMQPGIRGFSPQNIWRMRQFFETYRDEPVLSPLLRELPWSSNLHILSRAKRPEERILPQDGHPESLAGARSGPSNERRAFRAFPSPASKTLNRVERIASVGR